MDEDAHGSIRHFGGEDVERLDRRRAVGEALGRAEAFAGELAVAGAALEDVVAIGGVDELVIGVVEILWSMSSQTSGPLTRGGCGGRCANADPPAPRTVAATSARRVSSPLRRDGMEESARYAAVPSRICASTARPSRP